MRAYDLLLRLLPSSFRSEYADEMRAIFARRRRDAGGPVATLALWADAFHDVVACSSRVHLDVLRQDLRYIGRSLGRAPGFALTVVLVAALGVGATTAAFSITDHVLRPAAALPRRGSPGSALAGPDFGSRLARRAVARQLPRLAAHEHVLRSDGCLQPGQRQPGG